MSSTKLQLLCDIMVARGDLGVEVPTAEVPSHPDSHQSTTLAQACHHRNSGA